MSHFSAVVAKKTEKKTKKFSFQQKTAYLCPNNLPRGKYVLIMMLNN